MLHWSRFLLIALASASAIAATPPEKLTAGAVPLTCAEAVAGGKVRASSDLATVERSILVVGAALDRFNEEILRLMYSDEKTAIRLLRGSSSSLSDALADLYSSLTEEAFRFDNSTSQLSDLRLRAIAGITHDLRNLLPTLLLRVAELSKVAAAQPALYYDYDAVQAQLFILHALSLDANQLFALMKDPTAIPRIFGAKKHFPVFGLSQMLTNMLTGTQGKSKSVQIKVEVNPKAAGKSVYGNELVVRTAVLNLVKNAVEALQGQTRQTDSMGASGLVMVTITLNPTNPNEVVIVVADDGPGMPERIVTGAMAADGPATGVSTKGTQGVGLANVRKNIELNGGRMAIVVPEPAIGGTLVTLYLPTAEGQRVQAPAPTFADGSIMDLEEGTVLIVEDNHDVAESTADFLTLSGIPNLVIPQPFEVVEAISRNKGKVSIVLLDMNGLVDGPAHSPVAVSAETVAARILAVDPTVTIFYHTGNSPAAGYVYPDNVAGTLVKPVDPGKLLEQIQKYRAKP